MAWWKKGICLLLVIVALLAIFRPKLRQVQAPPQKKETNWSLMALGDVMLARNAGRVVSKAELSEQGLGRPLARFDRSIDVHLSSIRHKLGLRGDGRSWIETVRGLGYQLVRE